MKQRQKPFAWLRHRYHQLQYFVFCFGLTVCVDQPLANGLSWCCRLGGRRLRWLLLGKSIIVNLPGAVRCPFRSRRCGSSLRRFPRAETFQQLRLFNRRREIVKKHRVNSSDCVCVCVCVCALGPGEGVMSKVTGSSRQLLVRAIPQGHFDSHLLSIK